MRSAVDRILLYNRAFSTRRLSTKLVRMTATPFSFFRATFHLFSYDVLQGPFRWLPHLEARGPIVGDLHTENFGSLRAINGEIVYDINDFDETSTGCYEFDLRRLATSLILAALDNNCRYGEGVVAAEACLRSYLHTLARWGDFKKRVQFEKAPENAEVQGLLHKAKEKSRLNPHPNRCGFIIDSQTHI